jgi:hypothetical protein
MRSARQVWWSALLCGAMAGACSDALGPSLTLVDDLFAELGDTWSSSTNPVSVSPGITHLTTRPPAMTCRYAVDGERFICPSRRQSGLTSSTSFQLLDAGSIAQPAFIANNTAAVHIVTDVGGILPSAGGPATTLTAQADEIVSGLISGTHTLNGTATSTFTSGSGMDAATYSMVETTSGLVLAARSSANPWPTSGTIVTRVHLGLPASGPLLSTVTSSFDGTRTVTLVIVTGGATQTCTIDLKGATPMVCG